MTTTYTPNADLALMGTGDEVDTWGTVLNNAVFTPIDGIVGANTAISLTSSDVTLTLSQWQSLVFTLTGTLSQNVSLIFPISPSDGGGGTLAVGGFKIIDNQTTGNFTVTVKTAAVGSTGVTVPQATRDPNNSGTIIATARTIVFSDTVNVGYSEDRIESGAVLRIPTVSGNPSGSLVGTAPTARDPASLVFDRTNALIYSCITTGTAANARYAAVAGGVPTPQGYLTLASSTLNPVPASDIIAASTVYYSPFVGNLLPIWNGAFYSIYQFAQLTLALTSAQTANGIFDVFSFIPSGSFAPLIGTGPAWAVSTAGSGSRGTGAGTTELTRIGGLPVNANAITLINSGSTYSVDANKATYLGSLFIDSSNGQVSCYRSYGQSRKWGVYNLWNKTPVFLKAGDSTTSWSYASSTPRAANGNSANSLTVFSGLADSIFDINRFQEIQPDTTASGATPTTLNNAGIGWNSTTAYSGAALGAVGTSGAANGMGVAGKLLQAPSLGINVVTALENGITGRTVNFYGTEAYMMISALWNA